MFVIPRVKLDIDGFGTSSRNQLVRKGGGPCEVNKRRVVAATLSLQLFGRLKCFRRSYFAPSLPGIGTNLSFIQDYLVFGVMDDPK